MKPKTAFHTLKDSPCELHEHILQTSSQKVFIGSICLVESSFKEHLQWGLYIIYINIV